MDQLFPDETVTSIEPLAAVADEDRPPPPDRPWVYTNMIASADGGTAVGGLSGGLGGEADKAMFSALRAVADVILAGAATVREERYRPPEVSDTARAARLERGQASRPRLAIITGRLSLEPDLPVFQDPDKRPLIITSRAAPADRRRRLESVAEIIQAGEATVDLPEAVGRLRAEGTRWVLCEGGPSINGQMIARDLVDEWNLSVSPHLLGADSRRAAVGPVDGGPPRGMRLARVWAADDYLFCRWIRR